MLRFAPLALVLLVACADGAAPPADAPPPEASGDAAVDGFDPQAWLAEARGLEFDPELSESDDPATFRAKALAAELDEAVGWARACDTYIDPETGAAVYEPMEDGGGHWARGTLDVGTVSETEAVVAVTCDFGAYQGSYALVHIRGDRAALLGAPALNAEGQPMDAVDTSFSTPDWSGLADGAFSSFGLARGLGDCGALVTYALGAPGDDLAIQEVRQRVCADDIPDPLPEPEAWPVVYAAE